MGMTVAIGLRVLQHLVLSLDQQYYYTTTGVDVDATCNACRSGFRVRYETENCTHEPLSPVPRKWEHRLVKKIDSE
jgi:hypothetical protein